MVSVHKSAEQRPLGALIAGDKSTADSNTVLLAGRIRSDSCQDFSPHSRPLQGITISAECAAESGFRHDRQHSPTSMSVSKDPRSDSDSDSYLISLHERCEEICSGISSLGSSNSGSGL